MSHSIPQGKPFPHEQEATVARALREAGDYSFLPTSPGTWRCYTPAGGYHLVTVAGSCTCEAGADPESRCTHSIALGHKLIADGIDLVAEGLKLASHEALVRRIFG